MILEQRQQKSVKSSLQMSCQNTLRPLFMVLHMLLMLPAGHYLKCRQCVKMYVL
jgi:hypothetical protein